MKKILLLIILLSLYSCWTSKDIESLDLVDINIKEINIDYSEYRIWLDKKLQDMYSFEESILASLDCSIYLWLEYVPEYIHSEYISKCEDITYLPKISYYEKEILVKPEERFPLENNYRNDYNKYVNAVNEINKISYEEYLKDFNERWSMFPWSRPLTEDEFNNSKKEPESYSKFYENIKIWLGYDRDLFREKQEEYKKWLEENKK